MSNICLQLRAKNSSGLQHLSFDISDGVVGFTLHGRHNREPIQIDFDSVTQDDFAEFMAIVDMRLDRAAREIKEVM